MDPQPDVREDGMVTTAERRMPLLSRGPRRALLVAHVVSSVGWLGADLVLLALAVTGLSTGDAELAHACYAAVGVFVPTLLVPLTLLALATGVALAAGTRWGLLRHYWVVVKLGITVALTAAVYLVLRPDTAHLAAEAAAPGSAQSFLERIGSASAGLIFPPVVSTAALLVATVLSVYKPWGTTRWARRGTRITTRGRVTCGIPRSSETTPSSRGLRVTVALRKPIR